jgi:hypothetical protein
MTWPVVFADDAIALAVVTVYVGAMKPFVDATGPEKVVRDMIIPYMRCDVSVCMSSAGTVRYTGYPGMV